MTYNILCHLKKQLQRRFCTDNALTGPSMIASVVDPRYKNLLFLDKESREAAFTATGDKMKIPAPILAEEGPVAKTSKPKSSMEFCLQGLEKMVAKKSTKKTPSSLFTCKRHKWTMKPTHLSCGENAFRFPVLSKVARRYLAIPDTNIRLNEFSMAGNIVNSELSAVRKRQHVDFFLIRIL